MYIHRNYGCLLLTVLPTYLICGDLMHEMVFVEIQVFEGLPDKMPSIGDGDMDDFDDMMIFPLTDIDGDDNNNNNVPPAKDDVIDDYSEDDNDSLGRRAKRAAPHGSGLFKNDYCRPRHPAIGVVAQSVPLKINANHAQSDFCGSSSPKVNWMHAIKKIKHLKDPWEKHRLTELSSEIATRHRYHALKKIWVTDKVEVKMEKEANIIIIFIYFDLFFSNLFHEAMTFNILF